MSILARAALAAAIPLAAAAQDAAPDDVPRIAVVSAYAPEWELLKAAVADPEETVIRGTTFVTGTIEDEPVVLFLSGISMVNAAMTVERAVNNFDVTGIVFSGIAGGVDPALDVGDVVIADRWGQYLESIFARETDGAFSIPPWMSSEFPSYGMMFANGVSVIDPATGAIGERFWFPVDEGYLARARRAVEGLDLAACNAENACLPEPPEIVVGGPGVSGSAFVDNAAFREHVFETFEARVLDMESAAVAHVAFANGLPFIAFRSLSDLAGGGEGENELPTFFSIAAGNSAEVVRAFLAAE